MVMLNAETAHSEDDFSGNSKPEAGRYHVAVNAAEEKGSKNKGTPGVEIEFQVIYEGLKPDGKTHTVGQAGKTIQSFLSYVGSDDAKTKTCIDQVTRLALCCGILRPGEAKEPDWNEAIGRELVIEVAAEKYKDKNDVERTGLAVPFMGFWSLGNKAVLNVPKDPTSPGMQQLGKSGGNAPKPAGNAAAAATTGNGNGNGGAKTRGSLKDL